MTGTVYSRANASEVMEGWEYLVDEKIPLDIYTQAFYVPSLYSWLGYDSKQNIRVNEDTDISNVLEPLSLELLRLCYWINKCHQIITDKSLFENKLNEVRDSLGFQKEVEVKAQLNHKHTLVARILKDVNIPYWERELHANELSTELELGPFRSKISSLVPELMLAALIQEAGFDISFIPTTPGVKTCDLLFKSHKTEVKTFLDTQIEGNEENQMLKSMVDKIKTAGANVVVCQTGIDDMVQHYLSSSAILAVRRAKESDMYKLSKATGAQVVNNLDDLDAKDLGYAELVEERKIETDKWVFIDSPVSSTLE